MQYYSKTLNKLYDTPEECEKAEEEFGELRAKKKERAQEIEDKVKELYKLKEANYKAEKDLEAEIVDLRNKFIDDYKQQFNNPISYKVSLGKTMSIFELLEGLINNM